MCFVCKDRFNIHEKIAAHDYYEQLCEFNNLPIKEPRKRRLTKKSLLMKIENILLKLQKESNQNHVHELQKLVNHESDLKVMNEKFIKIMQDYYQGKLNAG